MNGCRLSFCYAQTPPLPRRLQAIATPLVPNMEKVVIIPPPKDVDPRVLVWKGAAVLGKMDGVSDLWITAQDWVGLHLAALELAPLIYSCPGRVGNARS